MRILQIGNFVPEFSTENDLCHALRVLGHDVMILQEEKAELWDKAIRQIGDDRYDSVLWTTTEDKAKCVPTATQRELQYTAEMAGVLVYGYHLDRWWGLDRWKRVLVEPFFRSAVVYTADGHHVDQWQWADVFHEWRLPAVSERWVGRGVRKPEFECDIAFVGNWRDYGHKEWAHRPQLVDWLRQKYRRRVKFFPQDRTIRGRELNDVYASAKCVVGDSCLVPGVDGFPMTRYTRDRMPETVGRGGLNVGLPYTPGEHLLTWDLGVWQGLEQQIEWALSHPDENEEIREAGMAHVAEHHTYTARMRSIFGEAR
jgi:hypothetical protein